MDSFSTKTVLGLSFHPDQVCLVALEEGCVQAIAARELIQPFNLETLQTGEVILESQIEVLQDLYQRIGKRGNHVGITLNRAMVLVKKIPVPLGMEEEMVAEQMTWEAAQFLVTSLDDYIMEYQRLPFRSLTGNPTYLVVLVRKKVIEIVRTLVERIGLILRGVDVDVFSNIRTLVANYDLNMDGTSVLVDIQREYFDLVFIRYREFFLSHRIFFRGDVSKSDFVDGSEISKLIEKELRRLVFGHRLGQEIEDLDKIFLMGSEIIKNMPKVLSDIVSVPLEVVNPFRRITVSQSVSKSQEFLEFPERFIASVGVALKNIPALVEKTEKTGNRP